MGERKKKKKRERENRVGGERGERETQRWRRCCEVLLTVCCLEEVWCCLAATGSVWVCGLSVFFLVALGDAAVLAKVCTCERGWKRF